MNFYIDANVFVFAALDSGEMASSCKDVILKIAEGKMTAATSVLTWDELVWVVRKYSTYDIAVKEGAELLKTPNLKFLPADFSVITEAQWLATEYKLKPRDAIHAASAIKNGIKDFVSDDPDFDAVKEIKRIKI